MTGLLLRPFSDQKRKRRAVHFNPHHASVIKEKGVRGLKGTAQRPIF